MNTWSWRTYHLIWPGSDLIYYIYAIYIAPWKHFNQITLNENEIDDWINHHFHDQLSNCWKLLHCQRLIMAWASSPGAGFATLTAIIFDKMDQYGRKFDDCTKPEFDVIFQVTFGTLFRRLRVVLWQKWKQFLKIYEWQSVYIPLFGPPMHWGRVPRSVHLTLPQILPLIHSLF